MKRINYDNNKIEIITEKKKLFSKEIREKILTILIDEIASIRKDIFQNQLNSMLIVRKDETEEFITAEELKEPQELQNLYNFLFNKKDEKNYDVFEIDIETLEMKTL